MISARTASKLCEVSLPTIHSWVRSKNIGNFAEAGADGKYAKYEVNEVAAWFFTNDQGDELGRYLRGDLNRRHVDRIRSAIGTGYSEDEDMNTRQPLLIEHDRPFVPAELRRKLLTEAETRGVKPTDVLLDVFAEARGITR